MKHPCPVAHTSIVSCEVVEQLIYRNWLVLVCDNFVITRKQLDEFETLLKEIQTENVVKSKRERDGF